MTVRPINGTLRGGTARRRPGSVAWTNGEVQCGSKIGYALRDFERGVEMSARALMRGKLRMERFGARLTVNTSNLGVRRPGDCSVVSTTVHRTDPG